MDNQILIRDSEKLQIDHNLSTQAMELIIGCIESIITFFKDVVKVSFNPTRISRSDCLYMFLLKSVNYSINFVTKAFE